MDTIVVVGKTFEESLIELDGISFEQCRFVRCKLVYGGGVSVDFQDCSFEQCHWIFEGPADRTLVFLSSLYQGFGPEGRAIVEDIFESVRKGTVGTHRLLPAAALAS